MRPMRIIGGTYRSRQLKSLKGLDLRPTSDRLRETLFNVLSPFIESARVLDLFAGTGAVGIEALSRGAAEVVLVEDYAAAAKLIQANLDSLGIDSGARLIVDDSFHALEKLAQRRHVFDIVYLDPPYAAAADYVRVLTFLGNAATLLSDRAIVVAEHQNGTVLPQQFGFLETVRTLEQSDATLTFYRRYTQPVSA